MRILALVPSLYDTSPGQRFRLEQWEPFLRGSGVEVDFQPFEDAELRALIYKPGRIPNKLRLVMRSFFRRFSLLRSVRDYDAVYVLREASLLGPPIFERWAHHAGVPLIFDFDDAIFVPYISPSNRYLSLLKQPSKTRAVCRLASHVMVGNRYLADYALRYNDHVSIVPTTIDTLKYDMTDDRPASNPPVIGWSGSYSTVQHLDTLRPVFQRLARLQRFRLRVIGTSSYEIEGVDVEALPWRSETEIADLRPADVGVMPLPDDRWSQGKCGLKALQYMALGIPTVCSPIGVNTEIIEDGVNGLLAATEDEWVEKLTKLLDSAELRERLGRAGRSTVESKYSAQIQARRVFSIFESVLRSTNGEPAARSQRHGSLQSDNR